MRKSRPGVSGAPRSAPPARSRLAGSPGRPSPKRTSGSLPAHPCPSLRARHSPSPPGPAGLPAAAKFKPRGQGARSIARGCARSATGGGRALRPVARLRQPLQLRMWLLRPPRVPGERARPSLRGAAPPRLPAGVAHARGRARGAQPPGNPPGSARDWPAVSVVFACQWHRARPEAGRPGAHGGGTPPRSSWC